MNSYFYKIFLPFHFALIASFILIGIGAAYLNWIAIFFVWFCMGPIGIGVGFHRLFSHRQFKTTKIVEYVLALFGTLSAYASLGIFIANHLYHHKHSDSYNDPSSPILGFFNSLILWRCKKNVFKKLDTKSYPFRLYFQDPVLKFISYHYVKIIYVYALILLFIDYNLFINLFVIPAAIEHLRLNWINCLSHYKLPLSYQNFNTKDFSQNNVIFGLVSFGFGWHNNHHYDQKQLINWHQWWEIDIEGVIGWMLSKKKKDS